MWWNNNVTGPVGEALIDTYRTRDILSDTPINPLRFADNECWPPRWASLSGGTKT